MSPLNRGSFMEYPNHRSRVPPTGVRPLPPPRFGGRFMPPPPRFAPGGLRPPRPDGVPRPNGMLPPLFSAGPRPRGMPIMPPMGPRGSGVPRGLPVRPWPRRMPPPQAPPRFRFNTGNGITTKGKSISVTKKVTKQEEIELKKPWMTDEIRNEIHKKNKLYVRAKKSKSAAEWDEFKDIRNKVTRMIRDAKNEFLSRHPEQAHLYPIDEEPYDQRDENCASSDDDDKSHYCEVCDRDFPSEDLLTKHKSEHALCGIDGCTFSAHPLLVEKHINMQHRSGLYERMKDLSTPEGIKNWIAERKRKYPTEANKNLREAEELEKLQRGEIIKQSSNTQAKRTPINAREKKRRSRKRRERRVINNYAPTDEVYRGLRPFRGTSILEEEKEEEDSEVRLEEEIKQKNVPEAISGDISDEDDISQTKEEPTNSRATTLSIPSSLVADYGTDDDDDSGDNDDECPEEVPIKKIKIQDNQDNKVTENIGNEETLNVESCTDNKSNVRANNNIVYGHRDKQKRETERIQVAQQKKEKVSNRYRNRLLEKLLAREIQHERNLICQCVKYIVDNNFFDSNNIRNNVPQNLVITA